MYSVFSKFAFSTSASACLRLSFSMSRGKEASLCEYVAGTAEETLRLLNKPALLLLVSLAAEILKA
jgi:hypothetical protein